MEADVMTPDQDKALALESFDMPLDERGRHHRGSILAGARVGPRHAGLCGLRGRAHRRRLRQLSGRFTGDGGPALPVAADVRIGTDKFAER
jgi:hypothetical protein